MSLLYYRPTMNRNSNNRVDEVNESLLEEENNKRWAELGSKVDVLKNMTMDINQEVKSQNQFLDGMGNSMGGASDMLQSTIGKIGNMMSTASPKHMYYLVIFIVILFFAITFFMR